MIKIVAFLIEHFPDIQACPSGDDLGHILAHAGFNEQQIGSALFVIQMLNEQPILESPQLNQCTSMRLYTREESELLSSEIRSLLYFLEETQALNAQQRELIINALMFIHPEEITLDTAKALALLVLWAHRSELPILIGNELLAVLNGKDIMQ